MLNLKMLYEDSPNWSCFIWVEGVGKRIQNQAMEIMKKDGRVAEPVAFVVGFLLDQRPPEELPWSYRVRYKPKQCRQIWFHFGSPHTAYMTLKLTNGYGGVFFFNQNVRKNRQEYKILSMKENSM